MPNEWKKAGTSVVHLQLRLRELSLRMERLKLVGHIKRAKGMLRAMSPKRTP
jgi:hypothetical protein